MAKKPIRGSPNTKKSAASDKGKGIKATLAKAITASKNIKAVKIKFK